MLAATSSKPLTQRSALELAAAIRAGETTAREVVEAHIEVLERAQPRTGAIAVDRFEDAPPRGRRGRRARALRPAARRAVHGQGVVRVRRDAERRRARRAARPPRGGGRADRRAPAGGGGDPARAHEHVRDDDVDRVAQPPLRAVEQRVRPEAHRGRVVGRRGRRGGQRRVADRPRRGHRRLDPAARVLQRRLRPHAVLRRRPQHRASSPSPTARRRGCSRPGRSCGGPRT